MSEKDVMTMTATLSGQAFYEMMDSFKEKYIDLNKIYRVKLSIKEVKH